jgi:hypothetical protein
VQPEPAVLTVEESTEMRASQTEAHQTSDWRSEATLTVEETGRVVLHISRASAYAAAKAGQIPTIRVGRRLLVPVAQLRRMLGELPHNDDDPAANGAAGKVGHGPSRDPE